MAPCHEMNHSLVKNAATELQVMYIVCKKKGTTLLVGMSRWSVKEPQGTKC